MAPRLVVGQRRGRGAVAHRARAIAQAHCRPVGGPTLAIFSFWNILIGLFLIAAVLLERTRYRSEHGERVGDVPGPAGGEPRGTTLDARFQPTDEHFEDPTTRQRMRVWLDPHTGERRYLPEE